MSDCDGRVFSRTKCLFLFILLMIKVVGCHRAWLCEQNVECLEDERIRLDRFVNISRLQELDELRLECNRKVKCLKEELGCGHGIYNNMLMEYTCIKDLPLYDGFNYLKSGTLLSKNYPNPISNEFRARLEFRKNVTLKLTFHDVGFIKRMIHMTVYTYQGKNWTKYTRLVSVNTQKVFPNARIFDVSFYAQRVWITFSTEEEEKPPGTIQRCSENESSKLKCPLEKNPQKTNPQTWIFYTAAISVLTTILLLIAIIFIWKRRHSFIQCPVMLRKQQEQKPDILTHFPSDGNIIIGDVLAQEIEAAAEAEEGNINNIENDDSISVYETIAVPHYTDFPARPRPSQPDLPPLPDLASYIEVLPT